MASDSSQADGSNPMEKNRKIAGGAATGGGMNFQAAVTAIACVYMARGQRLCWLDRVTEDIPVAIEAETGGAGDDIRLVLKSGEVVEVQVKKGLRSGGELWDSLTAMAEAISEKKIAYGVLVVSPTSSGTISENLATDIVRLGDGRTDNMSDIGTRFVEKLDALGLPTKDSCQRIRIQTVSALEADQASIQAARAELGHLCSDPTQIISAWNALHRDATALIEFRGRREVSTVLGLLRAEGVHLAECTTSGPLLLLEKLANWTLLAHEHFSIFGIRKKLRTDEAWIPLRAVVQNEAESEYGSLEEALKNYQAWEERAVPRDAVVVDPETLGRFVPRAIIVGGPGMGKTTLLKRIARRYSEDRIPVLHVRLAAVASRMQAGSSFEEAVFDLGLADSGIASVAVKQAAFHNWLLLCDGLDECGGLQEAVAAGATRFATGHPGCRMLVTTRPVGYQTAHFSDWRHYYLAPLESASAPAHLAMLVRACAPDASSLQEAASALCKTELEQDSTNKVVARSPLLLGLAASILARGGHLGSTREHLYEQIFELIDDVPNSRVPNPPAPAVVLQRYLDILGWQITTYPVSSINSTMQRCAEELARETGSTLLKARGDAETYLRYWQDVGMIERIGHCCDETLAWIHKSFGEFAAARYLLTLSPDLQNSAIESAIEDPTWAEVIRFASLLGLGDAVARLLLASADTGSSGVKQIIQALQIMVEANPPPEHSLRERIVTTAFLLVSSPRRLQAYEAGELLVAAARRFPEEVGPPATALLNHDQHWTRLIAWAVAIAAGPINYRVEDLENILRIVPDFVEPGMNASLGGGINVGGDGGRALAQTFILDAATILLTRSPSEATDAIVLDVFDRSGFGSIRFHQKAAELMQARGKTYAPKWWDKLDQRSMLPGEEYQDAMIAMYEAIFDALDLPDMLGEDGKHPGTLLHLSAFLEASKFWHVETADIWTWEEPFDKAATRETLKGFIGVSGIDPEMLWNDAQLARQYLRAVGKTREGSIFNITTEVDPPVLDWALVQTLNLDISKIEAALFHPSRWIVLLAAQLMEALLTPQALAPVVRRLLETGKRYTLWAASGLAAELEQDQAITLLLERLSKPLVRGCKHLFGVLQHLHPPWNQRLSSVICAGLKDNVTIAVEAAKLAASISVPGNVQMEAIIHEALAYWVEHEEPYPIEGGAIPYSPRADLITALVKIRKPSYAELKTYIADPRSDVKEIGTHMLIELLGLPAGPRELFLIDINAGKMSPNLLGKVLHAKVPLNAGELDQVAELLKCEDAKTRFNAMALLHEDYLGTDRIRTLAQTMTADKEQQISDRAFRILDAY